MALRNIVTEDDPILRKKCRPVDKVDDRIRGILEDMLETLHEAGGVGIAAPQVGILRRMFIAEPEPGEVYYMINPEILEKNGSDTAEEGCLSVPGFAGAVERATYVKIKALDIDGSERTIEAEEWAARVMQHEYDHLDGILYTDKAIEMRALDDDYAEEEA